MYIPHYYKEDDRGKLLGFIKENSFGVLVSAGEKGLHGTHLPFIVEEREEGLFLITHLAKANPQWQEFPKGNELLAIFTGPHGYVSPSNYEKKENVPTWNYVAVHAYGKAVIISGQEEVTAVLEKMIGFYEAGYMQQWKQLPDSYKQGMLKGIVAFEMAVSKLEGKYKLSQNKTKHEQEHIIRAFEERNDSVSAGVAGLMKQNLEA